ncbi:VOC family protein [Kribbella deserti]|uniref:VOC family protein n=1 Tax=Kribbella deserti TaxID=1926257 RepID=A0ABV6QR22_9ACTN
MSEQPTHSTPPVQWWAMTIHCLDPHATAEALLPLGGNLSPHQDPNNPNLLVLQDPAGHPLCLLRASAARRF